jgi:circadian clock protein KaiB
MDRQSEALCYELKLYVAGQTPRSSLAIANFRALCHKHLAGRFSAEIIDLPQDPQRAKSAQILATPTLVKESPGTVKKMVGTLSDTDRVLDALDLRPDREGKSS